jgi:hypothetical protein
VNFDITASSALDKAVTPAYTPSNIKGHEKRALVSINPTMINISIMLNNQNTDNSNYWGINEMSMLAQLLRLPATKGWKALYYPVDNTANDTGSNSSRQRNRQIVYQLGATDTTENQGDIDITLWTNTTSEDEKDLTDVNYIPVRFESCQIQQTPDNKVMVTLQGVVTG